LGCLTIQVELALDEQNKGKTIPSVKSINNYLKEKERTGRRNKQVPLPFQSIFPAEQAHQLWQIDAEGNRHIDGIGTVSFINVKDVFSKTAVQIFPCQLAGRYNHPTTIDYQRVIRLGMMQYGKCQSLQVDHDSIYFDNVNSSPFPTMLHLWLIGLGIEMCLTPKGQPQKQGTVERSHQTSSRQVLPPHKKFVNWSDLYQYCEYRRKRLNQDIPNRMLNGKAPMVAYPQARHSETPYCPKKEMDSFNMKAIRQYLALTEWYRRVSNNKTITLVNKIYSIGKAIPKEELKITYCIENDAYLFHNAKGLIIDQKPSKGLNFNELSGKIEEFIEHFC